MDPKTGRGNRRGTPAEGGRAGGPPPRRAATAWLAGRTAAALGGGPFARALAGLATGLAPVVLSLGSYYSMNVFDLLFWALIAWILVRVLSGGPERLWLAFGAAAGVGLLNKISVLYLGFAVLVGLLLAPPGGGLRR